MPGRKYAGPVDERTIGQRLREIRLRRGITQVEMAARMGIDQSLISEYERGVVRVHGGLLAGFAKTLGVSADQILGLKPLKGSQVPQDRRFLRRLQKIDKLSKRDKELLLGTVDAFLLKVS